MVVIVNGEKMKLIGLIIMAFGLLGLAGYLFYDIGYRRGRIKGATDVEKICLESIREFKQKFNSQHEIQSEKNDYGE